MSIKIKNVQPKDRVFGGKVYPGKETTNTYNVELVPRKWIRIWGTFRNHADGPQEFDRKFEVGDWAEYDSYNLNYDGEIVGVGEKTVTILSYPDSNSGRRHRLSLYDFCWRNWDYDKESVAAKNSDTMQRI